MGEPLTQIILDTDLALGARTGVPVVQGAPRRVYAANRVIGGGAGTRGALTRCRAVDFGTSRNDCHTKAQARLGESVHLRAARGDTEER